MKGKQIYFTEKEIIFLNMFMSQCIEDYTNAENQNDYKNDYKMIEKISKKINK